VALPEALLDGGELLVLGQPSMVSTSPPSAATVSTVQDFTVRPSSSTVHAPQFDVSQPTWVPVRPRTSRR
jgi:hypothetical protein